MGWKKKVKIFIPNRQFRETNTLLQIEICQITLLWKQANQKLSQIMDKSTRKMKNYYRLLALVDSKPSNARIRLHILSIWIQRYFLCWKKKRLHLCSETAVPRKQYENNYLFLVSVEFQLSNVHSGPHSSYFSPMVVWGLRKGIIFNPNRHFRDTNNPLQLQKVSNNTFMVESVSKQTKSYVFKNKRISKLLSFIGICRLSALQRKNQAPQFVNFSPVILFGLKRKWKSLFRNGNFECTKSKLLAFYGFCFFSALQRTLKTHNFSSLIQGYFLVWIKRSWTVSFRIGSSG